MTTTQTELALKICESFSVDAAPRESQNKVHSFDKVTLQFVWLLNNIRVELPAVALPTFRNARVDILKYKHGVWEIDCAQTLTRKSLCVQQ